MRYSWWSGRLSFAADSHQHDPHFLLSSPALKVALIVGISDMVGISLSKILASSDAPGGPWKVYGIARSPLPEGWPDESPIHLLKCNMLDPAEVMAKIEPLRDVTHLFWVPCMHTPIKQEKHTHAMATHMFENIIGVLLTHAPNLQHVCMQTSDKHYTVSQSYMRDVPFHENMPRLHALNVYHSLEDILVDTAGKRPAGGITWSVHRPSIIVGFSPWNYTNLVGGLAVYAIICKHEGTPFRCPGNGTTWERFVDLADANLVAEQEVWACIQPSGKNQAFNIANGDVISVKRLWNVVADKFGLEVPVPYNGKLAVSLEEMMKGKDEVWDEIVIKYGLHSTKLSEVGCWWYVDSILSASTPTILNMNKSKELGFVAFRNTEASILHWIDEMKHRRQGCRCICVGYVQE
ncbi:hypothetical protein GOP47_0016977 [Adiantum capillus-veneris]|uniref:PRISE-like Rossmann-fold domain-containing protein n=1 Tax=Adiantum capillus-veneris TaxID=13818 RepID=A0A9D4ZC75_ADICA|nr:hypothetical protein GOP47_0016977 [Adiantum capillus-veneris]